MLEEDGGPRVTPVTASVTQLEGMVPRTWIPGQHWAERRGHREGGRPQAMIGFDTSVLARYIVQDDPEQAEAAVRLLDVPRC